MRKLILWAHVALFVVSASWADYYVVVGDRTWYYNFSGNDYFVTGVAPSSGNLTIPSYLNGYRITGVGYSGGGYSGGFKQAESIVIPTGVRSIGYGVFSGCSQLRTVTISTGVASIGGRAFYGCSGLTSVTIPSSVSSIGADAFLDCSGLVGFTVSPDNLYFSSSNGLLLSKDGKSVICGVNGAVTIPSCVTTIDKKAFYNCIGLTALTIPIGVTSIEDSAFYGCRGLTSVMIPSSVASIGASAFSGCTGLTSVVMHEGVTSIGRASFFGCSALSSLTMPSSVTNVCAKAFTECESIERVCVPSVTNWSSIRFEDADANPLHAGAMLFVGDEEVTELGIPEETACINDYAFQGGLFKSVTLPSSEMTVAETAFGGCKNINAVAVCGELTSQMQKSKKVSATGWKLREDGTYEAYTYLGMSPSLRIVVGGPQKFSFWCGVSGHARVSLCIDGAQNYYPSGETTVDIPEGQHELNWTSRYSESSSGYYGYGYLDLSEWWQRDRPVIEGIFPDAFRSVTSVTINKGSEWIKSHFCDGCSSLETVTIPSDVTNIGINAFAECRSLKRVNIPSVADWADIHFENALANPLYMGAALCVDDEEISELVIPEGVTSIERFAFCNCSGIKSVSIPASVTNISSMAFSGDSELASVTIQNDETQIATTAFVGCSNVNSVALNGGIVFQNPNALNMQGWGASEETEGVFQTVSGQNHTLALLVKGPMKLSFRWKAAWNGKFLIMSQSWGWDSRISIVQLLDSIAA